MGTAPNGQPGLLTGGWPELGSPVYFLDAAGKERTDLR